MTVDNRAGLTRDLDATFGAGCRVDSAYAGN